MTSSIGPPRCRRLPLVPRARRIASNPGLGLVLALVFGCGSRPPEERFTPSAEAARAAVEQVLTQRRDSTPIAGKPGDVEAKLVDSKLLKDRPLRDFEVISELPWDQGRCYSVRLKWDSPPEDDVVRYIVLGIDPIWVFRVEDAEGRLPMRHDAGAEPAKNKPLAERAAKDQP